MFDFVRLEKELKTFGDGARIEVIGKSFFDRPIYAMFIGEGMPKTLIHGGIHARENITSRLVLDLARNYKGEAICFVPMVNPDGVELVSKGVDSVPCDYREFLLSVNAGFDFGLWKANGRAVDNNVNFDADWGGGAKNLTYPSFENYIGEYAESESETQALVNLTLKYKFCASISYHAKGEVIYQGFKGINPYADLGERFSRVTGYLLMESLTSSGGYKDWFVCKGFGLGLTIEVGDDAYSHPLPDQAYDKIYNDNRDVPKLLEEVGKIIWKKNL